MDDDLLEAFERRRDDLEDAVTALREVCQSVAVEGLGTQLKTTDEDWDWERLDAAEQAVLKKAMEDF